MAGCRRSIRSGKACSKACSKTAVNIELFLKKKTYDVGGPAAYIFSKKKPFLKKKTYDVGGPAAVEACKAAFPHHFAQDCQRVGAALASLV